MKKSAMPELKFKKRERVQQTDGQIIEQLGKANKQLIDKVDELRELLDERNARIVELEAQLTQAIKTGGVPF